MACQAGDSCLPANPCHEGTLDCAGGAAACTDSGRVKAAGSQCGVNKVCGSAGECVACVAGMACELPQEPCKTGKIECTTGAPACVTSGNAQNGKACGDGRVCRDGTCETCADGMPCTPDNKCHTGTLSCTSGRPTCMDSGTNTRNGTQCGNNQFCSNGSCVACTPNMACTPNNNSCKTGRTSCETGTSQCEEMGNQRDGAGCGDGRVCRAGECVSCGGQGQPCCGSACNGGPSCSAGNVVSPFCDNGTCRERVSDDCDPCEDCSGNRCVAKQCGSNSVCRGGSCVGCGGQSQPCCPSGSNGGCVGNPACSGSSVVAPFCDNGTCRERDSQRCGSCDDCIGNRCVPKNCGSGQCREGRCVEVVDNGRSCGANAVCKPGSSCRNGLCCTNGTKCLGTGALCIADTAVAPYRARDCASGLCDVSVGGVGAVCVGGSNNGGGCIGPPEDPEQCGMPGTCRWTGSCAAP